MKTVLKILIAILCASAIAGMPFFLSAPNMLQEAQDKILYEDEWDEDGEEYDTVDFSRLFFSSAIAEEGSFEMEDNTKSDSKFS